MKAATFWYTPPWWGLKVTITGQMEITFIFFQSLSDQFVFKQVCSCTGQGKGCHYYYHPPLQALCCFFVLLSTLVTFGFFTLRKRTFDFCSCLCIRVAWARKDFSPWWVGTNWKVNIVTNLSVFRKCKCLTIQLFAETCPTPPSYAQHTRKTGFTCFHEEIQMRLNKG